MSRWTRRRVITPGRPPPARRATCAAGRNDGAPARQPDQPVRVRHRSAIWSIKARRFQSPRITRPVPPLGADFPFVPTPAARKPEGGRYRADSLERWGALGRHYLARVAAHGLEATYWAAGEGWERSYNKLAFGGRPLSFATPQGRTVASAAAHARVRGVNLSQHEFATPHGYPAAASWAYLARLGVRFVRLPFKWEVLQPLRGRPLAPTQLRALRATLDAAAGAGVEVVLDAHNYGVHGGVRMSGAALADLWRRVARAVKDTRPPSASTS